MPSTLGIVASGVWTPAELAPDLWLDAADASTITESGGSVSQWDNKGLLGNFTQATAANQPTTGVSTVNGLNVLDFAGDFLTAVNQNEWKFLHDGTDWIIGGVWQVGVTANPNAVYAFIGNNNGTTSARGIYLIFDDRSSQGYNDALGWLLARGVGGAATAQFNQANNQNVHPANTAVVFSGFAQPSAATAVDRLLAQINNDTPRTNNSVTNTPSLLNPTSPLQIGALGNNAAPLTGRIAELVVASGVNASETNREILRNYLNAKWGVY